MNVEKIKQAISELSPAEFAKFRKWFENFENKRVYTPTIEEQLKKLRGSLKGRGVMKAFLEEKKRERDL